MAPLKHIGRMIKSFHSSQHTAAYLYVLGQALLLIWYDDYSAQAQGVCRSAPTCAEVITVLCVSDSHRERDYNSENETLLNHTQTPLMWTHIHTHTHTHTHTHRNTILTSTMLIPFGLILRDLLLSNKHQCDSIQKVTFIFTEQLKTPGICSTAVKMIQHRKIYIRYHNQQRIPSSGQRNRASHELYHFQRDTLHLCIARILDMFKNLHMREFRGRTE